MQIIYNSKIHFIIKPDVLIAFDSIQATSCDTIFIPNSRKAINRMSREIIAHPERFQSWSKFISLESKYGVIGRGETGYQRWLPLS